MLYIFDVIILRVLHFNNYYNHSINITRVYIMFFFIELDDELDFDFSESNIIAKKYRTYIEQQHARYEILRNAFNFSIVQIIVFKKKSFYIKIMKNKSNFFSKNSYAKWIQYVWKMKNQFDMNQMNDYVKNFDKIKFFFVVIFLKREFNAQLLWNVKTKNNKNRNYIWKKYVDFFKKNIKKAFIRKKNNFEKYKNYKQLIHQSVKNYDAHRIVLISNLHSIMKFSSTIKLQSFVLNFTQNNQNFLIEQNIENDKN